MTFTVDRLSLLVWVWTVQSLHCAHFCDPKPAYVHPPEPNLCFFNSSSSPISLCFTSRSTKICRYMEFSSSAWNTHSLFAALCRRCPRRQSRDSSLIRRWWQCRHIQQQHITAAALLSKLRAAPVLLDMSNFSFIHTFGTQCSHHQLEEVQKVEINTTKKKVIFLNLKLSIGIQLERLPSD